MTAETFANPDALAEAAAHRVAGWLAEGLARQPAVSLVVPGGRTPAAFLSRLGRTALDWPRVHVTLSDERWVSPEAEASNEAMVRRTLLQGPAASATFVPLYTGAASPAEGLAEVERRLTALPPVEAAVVGMGEDGHFASLFPGDPSLAAGLDPDGRTLCLAATGPTGGPARLSLTLAFLARARRVVALATGERKLKLWRDGAVSDLSPPVAALQRQNKAPIFFLWSPGL